MKEYIMNEKKIHYHSIEEEDNNGFRSSLCRPTIFRFIKKEDNEKYNERLRQNYISGDKRIIKAGYYTIDVKDVTCPSCLSKLDPVRMEKRKIVQRMMEIKQGIKRHENKIVEMKIKLQELENEYNKCIGDTVCGTNFIAAINTYPKIKRM